MTQQDMAQARFTLAAHPHIVAAPPPPPQQLVDRILGQRIREARTAAGTSRAELARLIGVSAQQQIWKYESGNNRITVALLLNVAAALRLPAAAFLDGLDTETEVRGLPPPPLTRDQRALVEDYRSIDNLEIKEALRRAIRVLARDARAQREETL